MEPTAPPTGPAAPARATAAPTPTGRPAPAPAAPAARAGVFALGVDSGGSGLRIALGPVDPRGRPVGTPLTWQSPRPVRTGERGIDAADLLGQVLPAVERLVREAGAARVSAGCVGAAGMATLGDDLRARLPDALAAAVGLERLALAADGVTAYAGALGQQPGAVVAAGTGLIALGTGPTDGPRASWRRVDGWGHLLGDCGSGAWIGRAGLEAALRAHDGRAGGSAALLERLTAVFGPPAELPGLLYPRPDRPAVLASFAPEVGRCATACPVAAGILHEAADHIARAARAAHPDTAADRSTDDARAPQDLPAAGPADRAHHTADAAGETRPVPAERPIALTGGLFRMGAVLLDPVRAQLARQLPGVPVVEAAGDPLAGALGVASALAADALRLPVDGALLQVV
ncbi:N-acetylglucosamine kinase [Streptomyces sp. 796.1]|uniref:N-acetylglucosamine kinase n=1 Tax=Streptomyces sp. 796.1 TaxID=3163029 RepID=UPI0039C9DE5C